MKTDHQERADAAIRIATKLARDLDQSAFAVGRDAWIAVLYEFAALHATVAGLQEQVAALQVAHAWSTHAAPPTPMSIAIDRVNLSVRCCRALQTGGVRYVADLRDLSAAQLLGQVDGFGPACLAEVKAMLAEYGLELRKS